ncbi:TPA: LysR family transcriptional regulator [Vibrio parahaemolyticus]|nr:LysR family transcriptional regulator [Vibrio parahaemolyticus]HCE2814404.1 LysR family transcriptional regulator [Vibrio parahaemolyticus]HCE2818699.1 LysR family transcriptional regulator [Vibrio parahaemolyticus]HCG5303154.1 LysR family transcriptional regulator [Vibrio parahaemolyticus]HCG5307347.1 LysR family transcriptional regulator [Vibrio parahaemolyticus]
MNLHLLTVFKAVYEQGSYSNAADYLDVTQPSITGSIKKLESYLGYSVFVRSGRGIKPTSDATSLYEKISGHVDAIQGALEPKSELTIYALEGVYYQLLGMPNVKLVESPVDEQQIYDDLRTGKCDIVIDHLTTKDSAFEYDLVGSECFLGAHNSKSEFTYEEYLESYHVILNTRRHNQKIIELFGFRDARKTIGSVNSVSSMIIAAKRANAVGIISSSMKWLVEDIGMKTFELPFETKRLTYEATYHKKYKNDLLFKTTLLEIKMRLKLKQSH